MVLSDNSSSKLHATKEDSNKVISIKLPNDLESMDIKTFSTIKHGRVEIEIMRKDSPYGNMKWHVCTRFENGSKSSDWFKTYKEANYQREHMEWYLNRA